jgi:hypothetical protein
MEKQHTYKRLKIIKQTDFWLLGPFGSIQPFLSRESWKKVINFDGHRGSILGPFISDWHKWYVIIYR